MTRKVAIILFIIVFALFLIAGIEKSLLFSRPYFVQSVSGFFKFNYGLGLGNFGILSFMSNGGGSILKSYSSYAHNIFLEMVSGIGVYSIIFFYWFYKVAKSLLNKNKSQYLFKALFLALTVNFMFDYTYFIPAMLYLWFAFLGISQNHELSTEKK
jgi:hypothetical protein